MTEKQKFINWLNKELELGLLDVHFYYAHPERLTETPEEEIYAELNRMNEAPVLEDKELF